MLNLKAQLVLFDISRNHNVRLPSSLAEVPSLLVYFGLSIKGVYHVMNDFY